MLPGHTSTPGKRLAKLLARTMKPGVDKNKKGYCDRTREPYFGHHFPSPI